MADPKFSADDYASALQSLLPRGRVWPRDPNAVQSEVCSSLSPTYERNDAKAQKLLAEAFPGSTFELLPEWESSLGLPDPCAGEQPTIETRRNQVVSRISANGGQTNDYFVAFAAALGFAITISEFGEYEFGNAFGQPINSSDWGLTLQVNAPLNSISYFEFGASAFGDAFASWGNAVLECELKSVMPAHMIHLFSYT